MASSSSGGAAVSSSTALAPLPSAVAACSDGSGPSLVEVSHGGRIYLDRTGPSTYVLTDVTTHECFELSGGSWVMGEIDGDVAVCCEGDGDGNAHLAEDLLTKPLYSGVRTGELYVKDTGGAIVSLDSLHTRHRDAVVQLGIGSTSASMSLRVLFLVVPKHGQSKIDWSVQDVCSGVPF